MQIEDETFKKLIRRIEALEDQLQGNPAFKSKNIEERYQKYEKKKEI